MKNGSARGSRSWASRVVMLLAVVAVLAGVVPASAAINNDGDGGGGGGDGGGGGGFDCWGNTSADFQVGPDYIRMGDSVTLSWHVHPACSGMTLSIYGIGSVPLVGSRVVQRVMNSRSWILDGRIGNRSGTVAWASVTVELPPTITITSDNQVGLFLQAIATPGQRIEIQNHVNLDLSYRDFLYIAPGVKIIGGRSPTEPGPRLFTTSFPQSLFSIGGGHDFDSSDEVQISGVRLQGAEMGSADSDSWGSTGITVYSSVNVKINNNELFGWRGSAVDVRDPVGRINVTNYDAVRVYDNFIHHNQHYGEQGYGVAVHDSGYVLIEKNVFDYNRHAIAAQGSSATGYYALSNLVLSHGGMNNGTLNLNTHMFDVHGTESCWGFGLYCGDAGEKFQFLYNTIMYDAGTAIKVRGKPSIGAFADHNVFRHPDEWGGYLDDAALVQTSPNGNFSAINNTFDAHFDDMVVSSPCDFNGDGISDNFLATGATWWYYPGPVTDTNRVWRYLYTSTKRRDQLALSYVNNDGICDVTDNNGIVYLGGVTRVPPPPPSLPLVPDVRGDTLSEASSALAAAGFVRGTVTYVVDSTCNNIGRVTRQVPSAGTPTAAGTPVDLSIGQQPSTPCP